MSAEMVAFVTIDGRLGGDPGITVTTYRNHAPTGEHDLPISDLERGQLADAEMGGPHYGNADRLLADWGYRRTGEWGEAGGQWSAVVELAEGGRQ